MSRAKIGGAFVAVGLLFAVGSTARADYQDDVLADEPFAYWRLGEDDPTLPAENIGTALAVINGTYTGDVQLDEEGLLFDDDDTAVLFNGFDTEVLIPDSRFINTGGPWLARTIELWFEAEVIDFEARMLYEEGGGTRGLSIYVQEVDGQQLLFMAGWNLAEQRWGVIAVSTEIEEGEVYHAVMVFDASENEALGDFDGRITGYLNGEEFDSQIGADRFYAHGNDIGIGGVAGGTLLADGVGGGINFAGSIDEVAMYSYPLDDPDDDGDFGDSRVLAHFEAGAARGGEDRPMFRRGDASDNGGVNLSSAIFILNFLFTERVNMLPCEEAGDINNDGSVNLTDPVSLLNHLFGPQPPPAPPGLETCGPDPDDPGTPGDMGCESYTSC